MRTMAPYAFRGMILWAAGAGQGVMVPPGPYQVRVAVGGRIVGTERFRLLPDPRVRVTPASYAEQYRFLNRVANRFGQANEAVATIRHVRGEVEDRQGRLGTEQRAAFDRHATALLPEVSSVEDSIYQTRSRSGQDPLNYPIRLNNKIGALLGVAGSSDGRPTAQAVQVYEMLSAQLERELVRMRTAFSTHLAPMNGILRQAGLPEITTSRSRIIP
jgi:hypothetical protein